MIDVATGKHALAYKRQTATGWADADVWVKVDGTYHQLVPPNCIILYDSVDHGCIVADGANGTLNLIDRFPRLGRNEVNPLIGRETHDGTEHGTSSATTSPFSHSKVAYTGISVGDLRQKTTKSSHTHEVDSHTHDGLASNIPPYQGLVPTMFSDVVYKDAVFLNASTITVQEWYEIVTYANQLRFTQSPSSYTASAHTHLPVTMDTTESNYPISTNNGTTFRVSYKNHVHTANHTMNSKTVEPYVKKYTTYKTKQRVFFDQLLSYTVVLCTSPFIPNGWSRYTPEESGIYMSDTADGYTGNDTHTHDSLTVTTGDSGGYHNNWSTGSNSQYTVNKHTHTFTDNHAATVDITPPSMSLYAIIKD